MLLYLLFELVLWISYLCLGKAKPDQTFWQVRVVDSVDQRSK